MFEITYKSLFIFITIIWTAIRAIYGIKNQKVDWKREAKLITVYICLVVIARFVYFPMRLVEGRIGSLIFDVEKIFPLWINLIPVVHLADVYDGWQLNIIGNITMFIPVGVVWPLCFKKLDTVGKTVLAGAGFPLFIEISQLLFYDRCSDVDDLILNTTGILIGALIYFGLKKVRYLSLVLILVLFETVAIVLWLTKDNIFYLLNFSYIGCAIALGLMLYIKGYKHARRVTQLLVGLYMLLYLGLICNENMQIEGFWYYLFTGVFEAATIHYAVAKIFGPLIFGRGWCGYACWTAMVLDFLPYKVPEQPRKKIGWIRYIVFAASFIFVLALFLSHAVHLERIMLWAFIIGNVLYYAVGIILAFVLKDNRAFCKYICPITVFMKPMSYFSLIRVTCDTSKCISCGKCKKVCPMDVDMTDNSRKRLNGTDCILCFECAKVCPKKAL